MVAFVVRGIDTRAAALPIRPSDSNLPDSGRLITALRQIGYNLDQAIADLVDNSVNAKSRTVLIRLLHDGERVCSLAVVDDGHGMDKRELTNAMRFGSNGEQGASTLGKFGMGLKLASLSHARSMTVFTRQHGSAMARRWTVEGISAGWKCDRAKLETSLGTLLSSIHRIWPSDNSTRPGSYRSRRPRTTLRDRATQSVRV